MLKVLFVENQRVKAGDVLVELDPAQPKARLDEAEAQLAADKAAADAADKRGAAIIDGHGQRASEASAVATLA